MWGPLHDSAGVCDSPSICDCLRLMCVRGILNHLHGAAACCACWQVLTHHDLRQQYKAHARPGSLALTCYSFKRLDKPAGEAAWGPSPSAPANPAYGSFAGAQPPAQCPVAAAAAEVGLQQQSEAAASM